MATKFRELDVVETSEFFCLNDPDLVTFQLELSFGEEWLSCEMSMEADVSIVVPMNKLTLHDADGKLLVSKENRTKCRYYGSSLSCSEFFKASDATDAGTWKLSCQVEYEKVEGDENDVIDDYNDDAAYKTSISYRRITQANNDYLKLLETSNGSDVTFLFKERRIMAHKLILSTRSKYFEAMFASSLKESQYGEIQVPDVDPKVFKAMLEFLYSGLPPKNLKEVALELLIVADKYGVDGLTEICESNACENLTAENVVDSLLVAEKTNCSKLLSNSKSVFRGCSDVVKNSEKDVEKLMTSPRLIIDLLFYFSGSE